MKIFIWFFLIFFNALVCAETAAQDENQIQANEKMTEFSVLEVIKVQNWGDCDLPPAYTFWLGDGSTWYTYVDYSIGNNIKAGQFIAIISMTDADRVQHREPFSVFDSEPYWIVVYPALSQPKIAYKMLK